MEGCAPRRYFMEHEQMDFETRCILGGCAYGSGEAGEILSTVERMFDWLATVMPA